MKGLWTTVTNVTNSKSYFVSTVKSSRSNGLHQTAVFRKIFGLFANFWRPQAIFLGGDAADLHAFATALVRDFDPVYWKVFEASEADAAFEVLMARLREELKATENR
jgi:hypothetical protein